MSYAFTSTDLLLIAGAYLLGSVSSAILVSRLLGLDDPRAHGSGNPGATNMLRTGHKPAAMFTLCGDMLKGYAPVWLATQLNLSATSVGLVGLAAVIGHLFPLFFQFRGGKGVATTLGVCLAFSPWLGLCQISSWLLLTLIFRISSLSALVTAILTPLFCYWLAPTWLLVCSLICLLMIIRHRSNLISLLHGREHRL